MLPRNDWSERKDGLILVHNRVNSTDLPPPMGEGFPSIHIFTFNNNNAEKNAEG